MSQQKKILGESLNLFLFKPMQICILYDISVIACSDFLV